MALVLREALIFVNRLMYCSGLIPLLIKNYKLKTSRGLSDGLVWCLFNAYITLTFFSFCLGLPFFYGVSSLVQLCLISVIIGQRFWYDHFSYRGLLARIYFFNALAALALIPVALFWPYAVGHPMGWFTLFFFVGNRIPQIIKVQRERSVYGFSYGFAAMIGLAAIMEMSLVLVYDLPLQAFATALWAFILFVIFTAQFYFFSWRRG